MYSTLPATLRRLMRCGLLLGLCTVAPIAAAQTPVVPTNVSLGAADRALEPNALILEVRLDGSLLSDGLNAYQDGPQMLLPLGELARLLTLNITVQSETGRASGYVLTEDRSFGLNVKAALFSLALREESFEVERVRVIGEDIYVNSALLSRWLPIDFEVRLSSQQLEVKPREKLPLQERLERERAARRLGGPHTDRLADPGYPRALAPYQWLDQPFIDQTFGTDARVAPGTGHRPSTAYTAYVTADVLGMEGAAYVSSSSALPSPDWRMSLGRNDPDAGLLGPMHARSFSIGNISVPSVANVMTSSGTGRGALVSNRPLDQPTSFDRQSLRGDLPPGWDVTLYYNDALLRFQSSRADGLYAFDDLPLSFGPNEFSLVFNGPLGQMRSERKSFLLDQSVVKPGEILYSLAQHHADLGGARSIAQVDMGLTPSLALSGAFIRTSRPIALLQGNVEERRFSQIGLRGFTDGAIFTSELTFAQGGILGDFGLKTRLAGFAVDMLHTQIQGNFDSDVFTANGDATQQRDRIRVVGVLAVPGLPRLPVAVEAQREVLKSGATVESASGRLSWTAGATALTNGLGWQRSGRTASSFGNLQATRRVAELGFSAQLGYSVSPVAQLNALAFAADRNMTSGYRVNAGVLHAFTDGLTMVSGGLSRNFGRFALAISASVSSRRELALGLQLFMAMGREPRTGRWFAEALPLAGTGAVSARAFVDSNLNGRRDPMEEFVANAGFLINQGGRHPTRSSEDGSAFLGRLTPGQYADIALDPSTLEDPLWKPATQGVRVLPRPGVVQMLEFPVVSTSEIDGTVHLLGPTGRRPIGDAVVELVDALKAVVRTTISSSDGFYLFREVLPGRYTVQISPVQAQKLAMRSTRQWEVVVGNDGDFISGKDLEARAVGGGD